MTEACGWYRLNIYLRNKRVICPNDRASNSKTVLCHVNSDHNSIWHSLGKCFRCASMISTLFVSVFSEKSFKSRARNLKKSIKLVAMIFHKLVFVYFEMVLRSHNYQTWYVFIYWWSQCRFSSSYSREPDTHRRVVCRASPYPTSARVAYTGFLLISNLLIFNSEELLQEVKRPTEICHENVMSMRE